MRGCARPPLASVDPGDDLGEAPAYIMRFPSLDRLAAAARATLQRFPLVLTSAAVAAAAAILGVHASGEERAYVRLLVAAQLGIPLFFAIAMLGERSRWEGRRRAGVALLVAALLAGFYLAWPRWSDPVAAARLVQLTVGAQLLVATLPYLRVREPNGFWQYNRRLFLRLLEASIYSGVLFLGLVVALVAVDQLFGIDVSGDAYFDLFIVVGFLVNTWIFLAGVPTNLERLDSDPEYPHGLKVLSQFVLLPLVTVYLAILTVYLGKVLVTRVWPSGWIGYLVSSVAGLGILSLLLVHPIREREENRWVATYGRWFYLALFPSIAMLLLAIGKRVGQYGVTEKRYFLVVLAVWLAAIAIHETVRHGRSLKLVPVTLCVLAFVTSFGPWGAYSVSRRSQMQRLSALLSSYGIVAEGQVRAPVREVSLEDRREISAVLRYLVATHGTGSLASWFDGEVPAPDSTFRTPDDEARVRAIATALGVGYVEALARIDSTRFELFVNRRQHLVPIAGFDYALQLVSPLPDTATVSECLCVFAYDSLAGALRLVSGSDSLLELSLVPLMERLRGGEREAPEAGSPVILDAESARARLRLHVTSIAGSKLSLGYRLDLIDAGAYFTIR